MTDFEAGFLYVMSMILIWLILMYIFESVQHIDTLEELLKTCEKKDG